MEKHILDDTEKKATPRDLFFIWFSANIGILGIVYGAIIVNYKLSFLQSILVCALGPLSFIPVAYGSLSGRDSGAATFITSRASFGWKGNYIPALVGWLGQMGWLSINITTGSLVILSIFNNFSIATTFYTKLIAWFLFAGFVLLSVTFSQETPVKVQSFFTYVFGSLTIFVLAFLIPNTSWHTVLQWKPTSFISNFLPALMFVIIGTGLTWTKAASDYSRYQRRDSRSQSIIFYTTLGAWIPLFLIMSTGVLLASHMTGLANSDNPIALIGQALPQWMTILYLLAALGGLIPMCFLGLTSSRLTLDSFQLRISNVTSVILHALLITLIPLYILLISNDFLGDFQTFLSYLSIGFSAWFAIYLTDYTCLRKNTGYPLSTLSTKISVQWGGVIGWVLGVGTSLITMHYISSIYYIPLTFIISGLFYYISIQKKRVGKQNGKS